MRHYQRGIATSIILVIFLLAGVAIASAYFVFAANLQKTKVIDSFEDCAKYYPVMESYPAQCNTPDGKHFVQELSEEEQQKLKPPEVATNNFSAAAKSCMYFKHPKFQSQIIQFMNSDNPEEFAKTNMMDYSNGQLMVDISLFEGKEWPGKGLVENEIKYGPLIEGWISVEDLCKISEFPEVRFIENPAKGMPATEL